MIYILFQKFRYSDKIDWISGSVPPSEPECGFDGNKCNFYAGKIFKKYIRFLSDAGKDYILCMLQYQSEAAVNYIQYTVLWN